jgi:hypothetical protein
MISRVLEFLKEQLNDPMVILSNPVKNLHSISLIHVEEDAKLKNLPHLQPAGVQRINLNLYVLISASDEDYEKALKFISKVTSFFQSHPVFEEENITVELYTPDFEQQYYIWAALQTAYVPNVIYKVRIVQQEEI